MKMFVNTPLFNAVQRVTQKGELVCLKMLDNLAKEHTAETKRSTTACLNQHTSEERDMSDNPLSNTVRHNLRRDRIKHVR